MRPATPVTEPPLRSQRLTTLGLVAAGLFTIDVALPLGVASGMPYAVLVGMTLRTARNRTLVAAAAATLLIGAGWIWSPPGATFWVVLVNRLMAVGVVWGTALLCLSSLADHEDLCERSAELSRELAARQHAEARFRMAVESSPGAMLMVDEAGRIVLANEQAETMFGYSKGEILGQEIELLVPVRFRAMHPSNRDAFFRNPTNRSMGAGRDLNALRKDGSEFPVEIGLNPIDTDEGKFVLGAIVDITERVRAQDALRQYAAELRRSNEELDAFAYIASHDLKAPLRAIDHLVQWIEEDAIEHLPRDSREHMRVLRERVKRMERLLDDLLHYSRAGKPGAEREFIEPRGLVNDVVELLAPPDGFVVVVDGELPALHAARTPLETVFRNLIGNAIKHHDREEGTVVVTGARLGGMAEFVVSDDGPGIAPEFHDRAFRMFQTLRPRDEVEGSGIGLALIKKVVQANGGSVELESGGGRGARFRFTWPVGQLEEVNA